MADQPTGAALSDTFELDQIMAEPDWIGNPVEQAWWSVNGQHVFYEQKQQDNSLRDTHSIDVNTYSDQILPLAQQAQINTNNAVYDHDKRRALFMRHGDVFLQYLGTGEIRQLTRTGTTERQPAFMADGSYVMYQRDQDWYIHELASGLAFIAADLRSEDQPAETPDHGPLAEDQLRLFKTLKRQSDEFEAEKRQQQELLHSLSTDSQEPWYLGKDQDILATSLSPNGDWLIAITTEKQSDNGRNSKMPRFVTHSGYVDVEDVRTHVGQNGPSGDQIVLLNLREHTSQTLTTADLPGINDDPLADLRDAQGLPELTEPRTVQVMDVSWHDYGQHVAIQLRATDNKDRWLTTVDVTRPGIHSLQRLNDPAWINWNFNEYGWLPNASTEASPALWFVSEHSGYSHFYTQGINDRQAQQHTQGPYEVSSPVITNDGQYALLLANRERPIEYELYRLRLADNQIELLTDLNGVESFSLDFNENHALVQYSGSYLPSQLALIDLHQKQTKRLTDTRSDEFKAITWQQPTFVEVPSKHANGQTIWSKLYLPNFEQHPGPRPVVMFVHGAGYTQNTHQRYPYYFREQMFHNLLLKRGYLVLDMDFRASEGYGRDWRTAIYQQMGQPELEDLIDGLDWLSDNYPIDRERVGLYGGSYGGFMALMAMFKAPEHFVAGAALRPVTDWKAYNHGYTSNILNTPVLDPDAYFKSSPLEHADGLEGHLLIAHGMLDDNVFYQDSVRLAQRLIELHKDNWELASYPLEPHSFIYADSWYDEYRRILKLFEDTMGSKH